MDNMKFICKGCGNKSERKHFNDILFHKKLCRSCYVDYCQNFIEKIECYCHTCGKKLFSKNANKLCCSNKCKQIYDENKIKLKQLQFKKYRCLHCDTTFVCKTKRKYCSQECRKKGKEKAMLLNGLKLANTAIELSNVKVYTAQIK